ncbi:hypothetical protein AVEN_167972-1 [Araneus ventricosus]|uniref:Uncharacterized protein n=1 Tax=Araneus ventricosus TaxID=182803 RepID=A0A4Y2SQR7_ARAVE|nr:hypothetical protein AVEN_167972-1 [Araneus ventricosus]
MRNFECHLTPVRNTCHETSRESTPFCTSLESCHNSPVLCVSQIREQPFMFGRSFPLLYVISPNELFAGRRREFLSPTLLHRTCRLNSPQADRGCSKEAVFLDSGRSETCRSLPTTWSTIPTPSLCILRAGESGSGDVLCESHDGLVEVPEANELCFLCRIQGTY